MSRPTLFSIATVLTALAIPVSILTVACGALGGNAAGTRNVYLYNSEGRLLKPTEIATTVGNVGVFIQADGQVALCRPHDASAPVSLSNCEPFVLRNGTLLAAISNGAKGHELSFRDNAGNKPITVGAQTTSADGSTSIALCTQAFATNCTLQLQLGSGAVDAKGIPQHIAKILPPKAAPSSDVGQVTILSDYMRARGIQSPAQAISTFLAEARDAPTLVDVSGINCPGCIRTARESLGLDFVITAQGKHPVKAIDPKTSAPVATVASGLNVRILVVECDIEFNGIEDQLAGALGVPFERIASWPAFFMFDHVGAKPRMKFGYQSGDALRAFFAKGNEDPDAPGLLRQGLKAIKDRLLR